jgi:hypothetical protein
VSITGDFQKSSFLTSGGDFRDSGQFSGFGPDFPDSGISGGAGGGPETPI